MRCQRRNGARPRASSNSMGEHNMSLARIYYVVPTFLILMWWFCRSGLCGMGWVAAMNL